jgi:hypothetical protein
VLSVLLFPFTWPIRQLKVLLYPFQLFAVIGPVLLVLSIFCFFALPTVIGGITLMISGMFYIFAAVNKEKRLTPTQLRENKYQKI